MAVAVTGALGEQVRRYRQRAGLTQAELAARCGLAVRSLRDLEHDRVHRPRRASLRRLAAALELSAAESARLRAAAGLADVLDANRPGVSVGVLGPLLARRGDAVVDVAGAGPRCLLGLLALQAGLVVTRDEIVDVLWEGTPPKAYRNQIQVYVGRLRRLLEPESTARGDFRVLVRAGGGYRLDTGAAQADVAIFDGHMTRAAAAAVTAQGEQLEQALLRALRCWRGPVLGGAEPRLSHHPAAVAVSGRRVDAALRYAEVATDTRTALALLRAVAIDEPLHEGLQARLMTALAADGQRAAALAVFDGITVRLGEELGIKPGTELRAAQRNVLRVR